MSIEDTVREKHEFERRVTEFLKIVASMSVNEIELALARVADQLSYPTGDVEVEHIQVKGQILKEYFNSRKYGQLKQVKLKRFINYLASWNHAPRHPALEKWEKERDARQEEWREQVRNMTLLKRLLTKDSLPHDRMPKYPEIPESELLIHSVAAYRLFDANSPMHREVDAKKLVELAPKPRS